MQIKYNAEIERLNNIINKFEDPKVENIMSQKTLDIELIESIENFVDAKLAQDWATRQKPFSDGLFQEATKQVAEKKDKLHREILHLTWVASAK